MFLSPSVLAACQIEVVELPLTMVGTRPLIVAKLKDKEVKFLFDSGAFYSIISQNAATEFDLPTHRAQEGLSVYGVNGRAEISIARVSDFTLKGKKFPHLEFIVGGSEIGLGAIGLLGQNFLGTADVEYDLAKGVARLVYPNDDCEKANLAYWARSEPVIEIPLEHGLELQSNHTIGTVFVNGVRMKAIFDTGASTSVLFMAAARRAGLSMDAQGVVSAGESTGIGRAVNQSWIVPIKSLAIGAEVIENTRIRVSNSDTLDEDMLLGADFFLSHRIYVAKRQQKIYLTYNGGPVFNLTTAGKGRSVDAQSGAPDSAEDAAAAPKDAGAFARRGAAYASRRDFARALTDLTRACELEPGNGNYFLQRARVRVSLSQSTEALADFTEALRLDPDDIEARIARAQLNASLKNGADAQADLVAADKLATVQGKARLEIASIYLRLDMPELAIANDDQWIASHGQDAGLAGALNSRCWARAYWGIELQKALDDCNAAIAINTESATYLDTRGLVYFRLGQSDKARADYQASLKLNPKQAWSLYGLGLLMLRQGDTEAGNASIAAARGLRPTIDDDAKRHGILP